jgi:hypothetical protein
VKEEEKELSTTIFEGDTEVGLGDDSNAPNPEVKEEDGVKKEEKATPGKRKRAQEEEKPDLDEDDGKKAKPKRAGHQIEVVRRKDADEGSRSVSRPAISNLLSSSGLT